MNREPRRIVNQRAPDDEVRRVLIDTRRTLKKLLANIDAVLSIHDREEERVTPE